tara:strand:- start:445 stop:1812 length:1368 start_codon:yes stop_codon:yes gene_type:complete
MEMNKQKRGLDEAAEKSDFFSTKLERVPQITRAVRQTAWQQITGYIISWTSLGRSRWHGIMLLELFYMLEVCCGSGASSRAMITYMRRIGRGGRSLLIDIMTLEVLLATFPELRPYLEDGSIVYFEACLTQMRQGDLQLLVEGLLGIPWSRLHSYHVSLACTTWSWACLSKKRYRTLEGAALDYKAQVVEKLLALTLKAAKDLHKVNGKAMITFESPKHGSFKSNAQVQAMLRIEGFWLVELDYCAMADETLDGAVYGPAGNRQGGVQPKKSTVVLVSGLGDDPQKGMDKCAGLKCPMVVPGTNHHVVVLCQPSSRKLHSGQRLVDVNRRSAMPMGVYARFMRLHLAWLQALDGTSFWCSKCGDGGGLEDDDLLLVCDSVGCGRAHHMSCSSLEPKRLEFWRCDMCVIAERVARRRRREASDMAVISRYVPKKVGATGVGAARKRTRSSGSSTGN